MSDSNVKVQYPKITYIFGAGTSAEHVPIVTENKVVMENLDKFNISTCKDTVTAGIIEDSFNILNTDPRLVRKSSIRDFFLENSIIRMIMKAQNSDADTSASEVSEKQIIITEVINALKNYPTVDTLAKVYKTQNKKEHLDFLRSFTKFYYHLWTYGNQLLSLDFKDKDEVTKKKMEEIHKKTHQRRHPVYYSEKVLSFLSQFKIPNKTDDLFEVNIFSYNYDSLLSSSYFSVFTDLNPSSTKQTLPSNIMTLLSNNNEKSDTLIKKRISTLITSSFKNPTDLRFGWEILEDTIISEKEQQIFSASKILIYNGYSFPYYNAKRDLEHLRFFLLNTDINTCKIYVQNKDPEGPIERLKSILQHLYADQTIFNKFNDDDLLNKIYPDKIGDFRTDRCMQYTDDYILKPTLTYVDEIFVPTEALLN